MHRTLGFCRLLLLLVIPLLAPSAAQTVSAEAKKQPERQIPVAPIISTVATAPTDPGIRDGAFQTRYLSNLNAAESFINISNAGTLNGNDPAGRICANIYAFDPNEEPVSCCACPITPNELVSLSGNTLTSNPLTANSPSSLVVKILFTATTAGACDAGALPTAPPLPAAFPDTVLTLVRGGLAWATTTHGLIPNGQAAPTSYMLTETPFDRSELSPTEYFKLVSICNFIETYASRFGVCKGCQFTGRGASTTNY